MKPIGVLCIHGIAISMDIDIKLMAEWTKSLTKSGNYVHAEPFAVAGKYVTKTDALSDGPFIKEKEGVAGYYIIHAENINQAVSIAQTWPLVMQGVAAIEIRAILAPVFLSHQAKK